MSEDINTDEIDEIDAEIMNEALDKIISITPKAEEDIEEIKEGSGNKQGGLYDYQINEIMKSYRQFGYLSTFASNELNKVAEKIKEKIKHYSNNKDDRFSFIISFI